MYLNTDVHGIVGYSDTKDWTTGSTTEIDLTISEVNNLFTEDTLRLYFISLTNVDIADRCNVYVSTLSNVIKRISKHTDGHVKLDNTVMHLKMQVVLYLNIYKGVTVEELDYGNLHHICDILKQCEQQIKIELENNK